MRKILNENLNTLYKTINEKVGELVLPVKKAGIVNFQTWTDGDEVSLTTLRTAISPKDVFFPQSETMMKFKLSGKNISIEDVRSEVKPFVLFGVKACDLKSFEVLDNVFLADPVDTFYQAKREACIVVTLACGNPDESCFCGTFGIDPSCPKGDATIYSINGDLFFESNTEKGKALEEVISSLLIDADEQEVKSEKERIANLMTRLPLGKLDISKFENSSTEELFNSAIWEKLSGTCLGCGSCTFVCPTCQCFDIRDFNTNKGVIRYRCWDSCMYSDFTQMAGGNNRTTQAQRFRQRFMHKLKYYPENNNGLFSCVGCGRCVKKCPQHLNIVKVIKSFGGENK